MSKLFGPIGQLGFVVRDLDAAMRFWTQHMGVGPFYVFNQVLALEFFYRGEPTAADGRIALANSGPLQIELIEQRNAAPSSYRDFLGAGHEGLHHVGFFTENFDADLRRALDAGLEVEQSAVLFSPEGKLAYFASSGPAGTIQELIAVHDGNRELFKLIADSSLNWDGVDPVRPLN